MTRLLSSTEGTLPLTLNTMSENGFMTLQFPRGKLGKASEASTDISGDHRCASGRRITANHAQRVGKVNETRTDYPMGNRGYNSCLDLFNRHARS